MGTCETSTNGGKTTNFQALFVLSGRKHLSQKVLSNITKKVQKLNVTTDTLKEFDQTGVDE